MSEIRQIYVGEILKDCRRTISKIQITCYPSEKYEKFKKCSNFSHFLNWEFCVIQRVLFLHRKDIYNK